jgi:DnaD/phage-associated family protein
MAEKMQTFNGFQQNDRRQTPLPAEFFDELLSEIHDLGELKITLYALWALDQQRNETAYLSRSELLADEQLLAAMPKAGMTAREAAEAALERAVQRGTLLEAQVQGGASEERYYFLNSAEGRQALAAASSGGWQPDPAKPAISLKAARPNIFVLYEQNIGALTPLLAERLQEAEHSFPPDWIEQAIGIAVANNVRKWRYVEAILENWKTKGKDDEEDRRDLEETRRRYLGGEFAEFIEH